MVDDQEHLNQLAIASQRGDPRSFRALVEGLSRTLMAMAYRYTGDSEWSRDLTQETWIRVYESLGRYDSSRPFRSWILAIHRNVCLSHLRKAWVQREILGEREGPLGSESRANPAPQEALVERREFHTRILRALERLTESQRLVFIRVDLERGDQREVAESLGMGFGTLRTTLHFARKRLATVLREMEAER